MMLVYKAILFKNTMEARLSSVLAVKYNSRISDKANLLVHGDLVAMPRPAAAQGAYEISTSFFGAPQIRCRSTHPPHHNEMVPGIIPYFLIVLSKYC
jgi:hypothetical protein